MPRLCRHHGEASARAGPSRSRRCSPAARLAALEHAVVACGTVHHVESQSLILIRLAYPRRCVPQLQSDQALAVYFVCLDLLNALSDLHRAVVIMWSNPKGGISRKVMRLQVMRHFDWEGRFKIVQDYQALLKRTRTLPCQYASYLPSPIICAYS